MPRNVVLRRRLLLAASIVLSLVLLTAYFREPAAGLLHSVQLGGSDTLSPMQSFATRAVQPFRDGYQWGREVLGANARNERLEAELEALRGELVRLNEAREENLRLKELLDLREAEIFPAGSTFVTARVIGKSPTKWQAWVQIDRGEDDGIRLNQPVVGATVSGDKSLSGKGLVGKVIAVGKRSARVQLIVDSTSSVATLIQGTRAEGILEGTLAGRLIMDFVERDQPVEEKFIVITSGFGQIYPKGIPVGIVLSVGEVDVSIYKQIEVRPFVDFETLEEVMVLTTPLAVAEDPAGMSTVVPKDTASEGQ
ncbi:MAG: rod shape-determining protein MreC [Actinobacteria bacterium]|nr:rod shape-determining protein MreC [Actinomycetota bacterium]